VSSARYFVFNRNEDWIVALDGAPIGRHPNREQAVQSAIVMADLMGSMSHDADVMVEDESGLGLAWTYGVDPLPERIGGKAGL
jgi:hypothetical protein